MTLDLDIDLSPRPPAQDAPPAPPRFTIREIMIAIAVIGIGLGLCRWEPGLAAAFLSLVLFVPDFLRAEGNLRPRVGPAARKRGYAYFVGVFAPLFCLLADPVLFVPNGMLPNHWRMGHAFVGLEMVVLGLWLGFDRALGVVRGYVSGILLAGAVGAGMLGLLLLPLTVIGLLIGIGVLGFTPFFTAHVYAVQGGLAATGMGRRPYSRKILAEQAVGALLAVGFAVAAQLVPWR